MHARALGEKLDLIGFSEHSPRPEGFNYRHEYREKLRLHLNDYFSQVEKLRAAPAACRVLLGMEMDWLKGEEDFIRRACASHDFDYLIGSVHFLEHWGFDDGAEPWENASQEECESRYKAYFLAWKDMLSSGLFQIAAHPDLIKIHSVDQFHIWLDKPESLALVRECLLALRDAGMLMEISSAGLRKPCREIYPCARIMAMAAELRLPVSFASDAHRPADMGHAFPRLASYARAFGYSRQSFFERGRRGELPF